MRIFPEYLTPGYSYQAEVWDCVLWNQITPVHPELRFRNDVLTKAIFLTERASNNGNIRPHIKRAAEVRKIMYGDDRFDVIIKGTAYRIVGNTRDYVIVIVGRDANGRNQYGFFHESLEDPRDPLDIEF